MKSSVKRRGKRPVPGQRKASPPEPARPTKKPRALARAVAGVARGVKAAASKLGSDSPSRVVKAAPKKSVPRAKRLPRARRADPSAVLERLSRAIERPHVELAFSDAWQLLVAVILSAQSTDRRVNQVTPEVFARWPDPGALASADPAQVEEVIKSTGFFRNKTKAIIGASAALRDRFDGRVPSRMEDLLQLPGVARKTANVVLGSAYQIASGIVVDTHAARVAQRLGLTAETEPEKIERDLCELFPRSEWIQLSHRLVLHGRYVCTARAPACSSCPLNELCPARVEPGLGEWPERAARESAEMEARAAGFTRV